MTDIYSSTTQFIQKLDKVDEDGFPYVKIPQTKDTRAMKVTLDDLTLSAPATQEKIIEKLKIYGGCIVRDYLPKDVCNQILSDMEPHLDKFTQPDDIDAFISPTTSRASGTCVKSKTAAEKFLAHPLNIGVSNAILGQENVFRIGLDLALGGFSAAQHNSCITFRIRPGAKDQGLHRDDSLHHNIREYREKYVPGSESAVGTVLGLKKATKDNGATRFIPGSHLWDHYRKPTEEEAVYAELDVGDCFFMLASCYHGGSANTTKEEERIVCILFMTRGILRQEENIFLGTPIEYFQSLSNEALLALGLQVSQPFCGWYENDEPIKVIKPDDKSYDHKIFEYTYHIDE